MSPEAASVGANGETALRMELLQEFGKGLHDLCQPLTTLQCRLYLGSTEEHPETIREVIAQCLVECEEVILSVNELQRRLSEVRLETGEAE